METVTQTDNQNAGKRKRAQGWAHVQFDPDLRKALAIRAAHEETSLAEVVRRACQQYLGSEGKAA